MCTWSLLIRCRLADGDLVPAIGFEKVHHYDSRRTGIEVPVVLRIGELGVEFHAKVDTGAQYCAFERSYGERLGIEIERGIALDLETARGEQFRLYGHYVTIEVLDYEYDCMVYFAQDDGLRRNVLGRIGWLDHFRVGIIDYDCNLYLAHYDS